MAIQMRRGQLANYDKSKMLPGEWGISIDNDSDNQKAFISFAPGVSKEVMMVEDAEEQIAVATAEAIDMATEEAEAWAHGNSFHVNDYASGDGSTKSFTLAETPSSIIGVYVNGSSVSAYTLSGKTITFTTAPASGSNNIRVYYTVNTTTDNAKYYKEQAEAVAESIPEDYSELSDDVDQLKNAIAHESQVISDTINRLNIFNKYFVKNNRALTTSNGHDFSSSGFWITDFLKLNNGSYLVCNHSSYKVCFYTEADQDTFVSTVTNSGTYCSIPETAKYARVQFDNSVVPFGTNNIVLICNEGTEIPSNFKPNAINHEKTALEIDVKDLSEHMTNYISSFGYALALQWENGSISGTTGQNQTGATRCRTVGYIDEDLFYGYFNNKIYRTILFVYDNTYTYLGRCTDGFKPKYYTKHEALAIYPTAKYFRIVLEESDVSVANKTIVFSNPTVYNAYLSSNFLKPSGGTYMGTRIVIDDNHCDYVQLPFYGNGQDGASYNNYFFGANTNGSIKASDVDTIGNRYDFNLDDASIKPHCNSLVFGNKYDEDDPFGLLYVNAYNAPGLAKGTCYVYRISVDENGHPNSSTLIQTISIGFTDSEPWSSGSDVRPYGNFFVDTLGGYLWAYTLKDDLKATRFFKFSIPDTSNESVTLNVSDILEQFDVPYMSYIQGNCYNNGKAYILSGFGSDANPGYLNVVNLISKSIESQICLNDIGFTSEPEFVDIFRGNIIFGNTYAQKLYT